ncbi:MAG: anion transporter [Elusimicrobiota bacterium]
MLTTVIIFGITYIGLSFGGIPGLRLDRAGIALTGAVACVVAGILSFNEAVRAIDFNTIILLLGMMMVASNLRIAGFFAVVSDVIKKHCHNPVLLLAAVILSSGILSALYVNDTVCIFFTPFVLELAYALGLNPVPYLIALVTGSNIGSVATITGNPQNMLIGIFSGIPYTAFFFELAPVAVVGLLLNFGVVYLIYRNKLTAGANDSKRIIVNRVVHKPLLYKTLLITAGMLIFFFLGYNISLVAITAAGVLLITRRVKPGKVYQYINWNMLMMFSGLFVVIHAVEKSGLSQQFFVYTNNFNLSSVPVFAAVTAILSNLVSNVPAVVLFKSMIPNFADPQKMWLLLAMASTFAGNLTIIGSVANLIVIEQAKEHVHISFLEYLKTGVPLTLATIIAGCLML